MSGKVSKRKQKALAFREKKSGKGGTGRLATEEDEERKAIPIEENELKEEEKITSLSWLGKDAASAGTKGVSGKKRKRKEDTMEDGESQPASTKKAKKSTAKKTDAPSNKPSKPSSKRYIAFVGNLPHLDPT